MSRPICKLCDAEPRASGGDMVTVRDDQGQMRLICKPCASHLRKALTGHAKSRTQFLRDAARLRFEARHPRGG